MELNNINLENNMDTEINLKKEQNHFLDTTIGKAVNTGLDIGLRAVLPDLIEEQIIEIKDNIFNYGLKEGLSKTVEEAINFGKSSLGIVTGNFESVSQMQLAVKNGGIIDSVSDLLDFAINKVEDKGLLNTNIASLIKKGKNTILNSIENNIEKNFTNQLTSIENLDSYIDNWKKYYEKQDFSNMDKQYKKIEKELSNIAPIESSINQAKIIENIHTYIKNNGQNFNLSETEMELLKKLT